MADKCANPEILLEVDESILEYLIFMTIAAILENAHHRNTDLSSKRMISNTATSIATRQVELLLQMVDSFLVIFHSNHPSAHGSASTQFRLRLLKFTVLFIRRFEPSDTNITPDILENLRSIQRQRSHTFRSHRDLTAQIDLTCFLNSPPFPPCVLQMHKTRLLNAFAPNSPLQSYYGSPESLSLLDTLPLFMALSAAQNVIQGNKATDLWMRLAARYMAEAVLEQYLVFGTTGPDLIWDAFAYGFDVESLAEEGSDELLITNLFWGGEDEREVVGWQGIIREHLEALVPPEGITLQKHLEDLEGSELSLVSFETRVVEFLETLLHAQPPPALVQVERGDMDGSRTW